MNQQKQYRPNLDRALAVASGPVQFLASDGHPLDEGKWTDPLAMLQHAADVKAATISVPTPGGAPIRFDASGQPVVEAATLPPRTRIRLVKQWEKQADFHPELQPGMTGTIQGTYMAFGDLIYEVAWDNGLVAGLHPQLDQFEVIEAGRPVAEQSGSGSDLARELSRAGDYLGSATVVIRTVAGKAGWPEARQQLEDLERSVDEVYARLSKVVNDLTFLYIASVRPAREAVHLYRQDQQTLVISGSDETEVSQWVDTFVGKIGGVGTKLGLGRYEVVVSDPAGSSLDVFLPVGQTSTAAFMASAMTHTQEAARRPPLRTGYGYAPFLNWARVRREDPHQGWVNVIQQGNIEVSKWAARGRWYAEIMDTATGLLVDMFDDPSEKAVDDWVVANWPI